ncbi:unnamed protein product [Haemonchus placei]|uniref:Uncharacterized protein n=1 Tax=Haemonchus placei TaxID=6290 RepID=A0A3P7Z8V0_HAEPC|nr:unnamed protein product [Haemonchus placei]
MVGRFRFVASRPSSSSSSRYTSKNATGTIPEASVAGSLQDTQSVFTILRILTESPIFTVSSSLCLAMKSCRTMAKPIPSSEVLCRLFSVSL